MLDFMSKKLVHQADNCFVILPVFNDHRSCLMLLEQIAELNLKVNLKVIVVDDASLFFDHSYKELKEFKPKGKIKSVDVLELDTNLGVNGAIYEGLNHALIYAKPKDLFLVMDSDGEDSPNDIQKLFAQNEDGFIIVAKRQGFSRSLIFNLWRTIFIFVMKLTTGKLVNFGNFSLFGFDVCQKLFKSRNLRISYVGAVLATGVKVVKVPIKRGDRYIGKSVSGRFGQIQFGFRIMSCFIDLVLTRILQLCFMFLIMNFIGVLIIIYLKLASNAIIPGWTSLVLVILASSSVQLLFTLSMLILVYIHLQRLFLRTTDNLN
jgi:glycosyltransferase involved in cell wall biosynthesis